MKNFSFPSWTRETDKAISSTTYRKPVGNDIVVSVEFDNISNEYVSSTHDTGTYENDKREKLSGTYENTKEKIKSILDIAEKLKHYSHSNLVF